jgi:hypothetical protein
MAKAKAEKLNFSKFFPDSTAFISVNGSALGADDFNINVKIGDGDEAISIFASDWFKDDALAQLKAIQEGVQKAIDFHQKVLSLPKLEVPNMFDTFGQDVKPLKPVKRVLKSTETAPKKKAVKK